MPVEVNEPLDGAPGLRIRQQRMIVTVAVARQTLFTEDQSGEAAGIMEATIGGIPAQPLIAVGDLVTVQVNAPLIAGLGRLHTIVGPRQSQLHNPLDGGLVHYIIDQMAVLRLPGIIHDDLEVIVVIDFAGWEEEKLYLVIAGYSVASD